MNQANFTLAKEAALFIGRERELSLLRKRYKSSAFELVGIYGRRRVGKTSLINEFVCDLPCGYCMAVEDDREANLRVLSRAVFSLRGPNAGVDAFAEAPVYPNFESAIEAAFEATRSRRAVLVIDEFPYLAKAYPAFPSILQSAIDRNKDSSKLFLILCGSSLSFMKEQLLDGKSPLYGRRTAQIELKPFDFFEALEFFPGVDPREAACVYGMVGGIPLYLRQYSASLSLAENISAMFLDPGSILYEEPSNLIKQEVSKAAPYNAVIAAIAGGAAQHNEIAAKAGMDTSALDYYLKGLARIDLLQRVEPIGGKGGRKALWHIKDNLFRFWYRFIGPRRAMIERGMGDMAVSAIEQGLPLFMGPVFETMCRDWLWRECAAGSLDFPMTDVGCWWGNDPKERSQAEIDIVAVDGSTTTLVGECKWRGEPTDVDQLRKLDARAWLAGAQAQTPRWLFSKSAYTDACKAFALNLPSARLVTFEEIVR